MTSVNPTLLQPPSTALPHVSSQGQVELDEQGYIKVRVGTPETNVEGVFAAGDVQDKEWRQVCDSRRTQHLSHSVNSKRADFC